MRTTKFICAQCGSQLKSIRSLLQHQAYLHKDAGQLRFNCTFCNERFPNRHAFYSHRNAKHKFVSSFRCLICNSSFKSPGGLRRHEVRRHSLRRIYECKLCPARFESGTLHHYHELRHTSKSQMPFKYARCPHAFTDKTSLKLHLANHGSERPFACPQCSASFKTKACMREHYRYVHTDIGKDFRCKRCFVSFTISSDLNAHRQHCVEQPKLTCSHCLAYFRYRHSLSDHLRVHSSSTERPFSCRFCPLTFKSSKASHTHERRYHIKANDRPFKCALCSHASRSRDNLLSHLRGVHDYARKCFKCDICGATFKTNGSRLGHQRRHTAPRAFKCSVSACKAAFKSRAELQSHALVHTDSRSFKCNLCTARFKSKRGWDLHRLVHHGKLSKLGCCVCLASFPNRQVLHSHLATHSDERTVSCSACPATFRTRPGLNAHIGRLHPEQLAGLRSEDQAGSSRIYRGPPQRAQLSDKPFSCARCTLAYKYRPNLQRHMREAHLQRFAEI